MHRDEGLETSCIPLSASSLLTWAKIFEPRFVGMRYVSKPLGIELREAKQGSYVHVLTLTKWVLVSVTSEQISCCKNNFTKKSLQQKAN